mgnify:CR=1 FL=1
MIELNIYSDDIKDMEERLDRAFDIRNGWGSEAVSDGERISLDKHFPQGSMHAVIQMQQIQIDELMKTVNQLKKKTGWISGYDDHGWDTSDNIQFVQEDK